MLLVAIVIILTVAFALELFLFRKLWSKGLEIKIEFDRDSYVRGDKGKITETVENAKRLPLPLLLLSFGVDNSIVYTDSGKVSISDRSYRSDCMALSPMDSQKREYGVEFTQRGVFVIGDVSIYSADLFMSEKSSGKITFDKEIYVYPRRMGGVEVSAVVKHLTGEYLNRRFIYEDPFEFKGIRDYVHTDPMKKINWNAFAKTGELKVNEYYDTRGLDVTILLNLEPEGMSIRKQLVEAAIEITRTIFEDMIRQGIPVRLITNAVDMLSGNAIEINEGAGVGHSETCLHKLARVDALKFGEKFEEVFARELERKGERALAVLISVSQKPNLITAYEQYLNGDEGEMIIPITSSAARRVVSQTIHATYVEVNES